MRHVSVAPEVLASLSDRTRETQAVISSIPAENGNRSDIRGLSMEGPGQWPTRQGIRLPTWNGVPFLAQVRHINGRLLDILSDFAKRPHTACNLEIVARLRHLWCGLDQSARTRLARFPVSLCDVRFGDDQWWRAAPTPLEEPQRPTTFIPAKRARELNRGVLLAAWSISRENYPCARLLFGMTEGVARRLRILSLSDIDQIATQFAYVLRPRWEHRVEIGRASCRERVLVAV